MSSQQNELVVPSQQIEAIEPAADKDLVTITRKIQLLIHGDADHVKETYSLLRSWEYQMYRAANLVVNHQYFNQLAMFKVKKVEGYDKPGEARQVIKDLYDTGIQNSTYRLIGEEFPELPSSIRTALNSKVVQKYNATLKGVLKGECALSTYRYGMPIPFNVNSSMQFKVEHVDGKETYMFPFLKGIKFILFFGKDKSNNRAIVDHVMAGEYKFCDSEIKFDDKKIFLMLTVRFKRGKTELDYTKTAATNLGMNCPIFVTTSNGLKKQIGTKEEFLNVRLQMKKRYTKLQKDLVMAKGGHGRARKLKALDRLKLAEANFATTYNHKLSHHLIKFCVDNGIGNLKMEDLLGSAKTMNKAFVLRFWSYYQLQQFIEYKAKAFRVNVTKESTSYFTQMCNCCKNISEQAVDLENRVYTCVNKDCAKHEVPVDIDENNSLNLLMSEQKAKPVK